MSLHSHVVIFIIILLTVSGYSEFNGRRAAEYENSICEPNKKHLDLEGCGECICKSHGYGSLCEQVTCSKTFKRPIHDRECTPMEDFSTYCHYCKCSAGGIPVDCREKRSGCLDELMERLQIKRLERRARRNMREKQIKIKIPTSRFLDY
ncbi:uncharacterized protein LOC103572435 [Microplitis demolitor]|uniref:uncharacterized protein LOC103572435 n=1 Tax=Microplitis demolitor TaxID=69319 RepID=UPI0004CD9909|nr:uncharacterized protein LOC103572435 [Microplitis demolitor]